MQLHGCSNSSRRRLIITGWIQSYVTATFSGVPETKGDQIRSGYLTPAFLKAKKRAEMLGPDCEALTPTQGAMHKSVDCESLTPTQGATQRRVD